MDSDQQDKVYGSGTENLPSNPVTKERLRVYYDKFFEESEFRHYDDKSTRRILRSLLRKSGIGAGHRVLDLGCATGFYTGQLNYLGLAAVGIDISAVAIGKAKSRYPDIPFVVGDAARLPFANASFDLIFMSGCSLTNTRDFPALQSFFKTLTDYLAEDGMLVFLGATDFSGDESPSNEWIYHSYQEIKLYLDPDAVRVRGPYVTNLRLLSHAGGLVLNGPASFLFRNFPGRRRWSIVYLVGRKRA